MKSFNLSLSSLIALTATGALLSSCDGRRAIEEATFRVETVDLEKTDVLKQDSFGLPQSKKFTFKACITDAQSRSKIAISRFTVSDGSAQKEIITDGDGCMKWTENHSLSALQQEKVLKMERTFTSLETYTGSVTVSLTLNPWQDRLTDLRKTDDPDFTAQTQGGEQVQAVGFEVDLGKDGKGERAPFSRAALADVKLTFNGHDVNATEITSLLTLKPAQKFRLSLKPQFLHRNIKNEETTLELKGGEFKLRLLIVSENAGTNPTAADIVASAEENMIIQSKGLAQKDITVRIHDVASILSRNQFFLIVEPKIAGRVIAKPGVYKGFVGPLAGNDAEVDLIPVDESVENAFLSSVTTALSQVDKKVRAIDLLQSQAGMIEEKGASKLKSILAQTFKDEASANRELAFLCERVYHPDQVGPVEVKRWFGWSTRVEKRNLLEYCLKNPSKSLRLERREFVEEVLGKPRFRADLVTTKSIELSKDLTYKKVEGSSFTRKHTKEFGWSIGGEAKAQLSGEVGGTIGTPGYGKDNDVVGSLFPTKAGARGEGKITGQVTAGVRGSIGTDRVWADGLEESSVSDNGAHVSEMKNFSIASVGYDINVRVRTCVLLAPMFGEGKGLFACADKTQDKIATESYHQVNQSIANTVFADAMSSQSTLWRVLIRGESISKQFETLMTQGKGTLRLVQLNGAQVQEGESELTDFRVMQSFPGVLSL